MTSSNQGSVGATRDAKTTSGSQVDYVLVALLEAGGAEDFVDIEDIAVTVYRLAPYLFRWRRYPQYPSAELTRMALRHAEQRGPALFVKDTSGRARRFTAVGLQRARDAEARLATVPTEVADRTPRRPAARDLARMESHPALSKWKLSGIGRVSRYDLADLLLCSPGSSSLIFLDRLNAASAAATQWGRAPLVSFLGDAITSLPRILGRGDDDRR